MANAVATRFGELAEHLRKDEAEAARKAVSEMRQLMTFVDDSGRLAVHWAATGGCVSFLELAAGIDSSVFATADDAGWTPLMIAASAGRLPTVRYLLSSPHSDVNHKNNNGQTPLHYACSKNQLPIAKLLVENGAEVNAQDKYGAAPLHRAAGQGHLDVVNFLAHQAGIRIDIPDREGNTPLHLACEDNQDSVAILLVQRGANPKRENKEEKTPLELTQNAELRRKLLNAAGQH